jgi:Na+-transporting methylmalonyl-CoA/oxaloacetate decarboxylase gamma subunit
VAQAAIGEFVVRNVKVETKKETKAEAVEVESTEA